MKLRTVKSEGLAHNSYFLSDEGEAVVIDPRRDCQIYALIAEKECSKIKYILETHRNEDYVVGSLELQNMVQSEIAHSKELPFKYGEHNLADNDTLKVGNTKIRALYTPGHTNESLCYIVYPSGSTEPNLIFSGDTLFAGSVGRTDLYGKSTQPAQSEKLYNSLHEKLLPLGDHLLVYPAHGHGSVCGHGISGMEPTTIGYEKKNNSYLHLEKDDFIQKQSTDELVVPRYFSKMEDLNLSGPPLLAELAYPSPLSLEDFYEHLEMPEVLVVDTRMPNAFAGSHIQKALNIWMGGTSVYPGWLLDIEQYIIFVLEYSGDIDIVTPRLRRLGFDNMCGYLCGGMNEWQEAGKPFKNTGTMSVIELKNKLDNNEVQVVDVREPSEWIEDGYVEGTNRIFFADLPDRAASLSKDKPIAVTCSVGNRSSIAVSLLQKEGFANVSNVLGGMTAWTKLGFPLKK